VARLDAMISHAARAARPDPPWRAVKTGPDYPGH